MNTKKIIAMMASVMLFGTVAAACGDSNKENKTPHTTYSADQINNMSDDELEKALENAAKEIEMSEKAGTKTEAPAEEIEEIDLWKDVQVTFSGADGFLSVDVKYVGDNQVIKDNVELIASTVRERGSHYFFTERSYKTGYEYPITAWYDEAVLAEQGVFLKKNKDTLEGDQAKWKNYEADIKFYTIPELGKYIEITDDTDTTIFIDALDSITSAVKTAAQNDKRNFEWAKNNEIYPTEFYLVKDSGSISTGEGYISYSDKDGNFLCWVKVDEINHLNIDGTWCKEAWEEYSNYSRTAVQFGSDNPEYALRFRGDYYLKIK